MGVFLMDKERFEEMGKLLAAFPHKLLQDLLTLQTHCGQSGISMEEVSDYVTEVEEERKSISRAYHDATVQLEEKAPRCKLCGNPLVLEPINNTASRMVDDHSNSWWICHTPDCEFEPETSDKYIHQVLSDLGVLVHPLIKAQLPRPKVGPRKKVL
jgi:hypothetical protein